MKLLELRLGSFFTLLGMLLPIAPILFRITSRDCEMFDIPLVLLETTRNASYVTYTFCWRKKMNFHMVYTILDSHTPHFVGDVSPIIVS